MSNLSVAIGKFLSSESVVAPVPSKFKCKICGHEGNTETEARHECKDKTYKMADRAQIPEVNVAVRGKETNVDIDFQSGLKKMKSKPEFESSLKAMADLLRESETLTKIKLPPKPGKDPEVKAPEDLVPTDKDLDKRVLEKPLMRPKDDKLPPKLPEDFKSESSLVARIKRFI